MTVYEVGVSKSLVAWHVMPDMEGPEGELHSHDYRLDIVVSRAELDELGGVVAGKNLEIIQPPDAGPVTVEVFARWVHRELGSLLPIDADLSVRVWESPLAFGGYAGPIRSS